MLKDRKPRRVVTHRIACGRPGKTRPTALDHFEVTLAEAADDGSFPVDREAHRRLAELGYQAEKPKRIPIRLLSDDIDESLHQAYESRAKLPVLGPDGEPVRGRDGESATRLAVWCSGDGETAHRRTASGDTQRIPCCASPGFPPRRGDELSAILGRRAKHDPLDGKRCPFAQNNDPRLGPTCKPTTELFCRTDVAGGIGGLARFRSHGHMTADAIRTSLEQIKVAMPGGVLTDVPLDLVLTMRQVSVPGSTIRTMKPQVHVELRLPPEETVRLLQANLAARGQVLDARRMLTEARAASMDEDTGQEWPETSASAPVLEAHTGGGGSLVVDHEPVDK